MTLKFYNGYEMPIIGLGTWQASADEVETAVLTALKVGYRLIDTAYNYGNEAAIGKALEKWFETGGTREEVFITTKLPNWGNRPEDVPKYLSESLNNLGLKYVDLYLIHHPFGFKEQPTGTQSPVLDYSTNHLEIWKALETEVKAGRVKNIGLSNFNKEQVEKIVAASEIKPANLQIELNAHLQQPELVEVCQKLGVTITAYAPIGSPNAINHFKKKYGFEKENPTDLLGETVVQEIAENLGKTPAQILLKFLMQKDIAVIPKSSSPKRIEENFQSLNVNLDNTVMHKLLTLDRGEKGRTFDFLFFTGVENHPEYPFKRKSI